MIDFSCKWDKLREGENRNDAKECCRGIEACQADFFVTLS